MVDIFQRWVFISFRNSKPKSRTQNIMIWNKDFVLPFKQVSCADCRRSNYLRGWTTCFPHSWLMALICLQKGCELHICCCLLSTNLLLGDHEHPCLPPKPKATENTQILGAVLKTNNRTSCSGVPPSTWIWTSWDFANWLLLAWLQEILISPVHFLRNELRA